LGDVTFGGISAAIFGAVFLLLNQKR